MECDLYFSWALSFFNISHCKSRVELLQNKNAIKTKFKDLTKAAILISISFFKEYTAQQTRDVCSRNQSFVCRFIRSDIFATSF